MRIPITTKRFDQDLKRMLRRGYESQKIRVVMSELAAGGPLDRQYRDHALIGRYKGRRECHVEPDWLLIYVLSGDRIIFERTGTHADFFE